MVLDQRTLALKYRIPISEVAQISLSPYNDDLVIFHVKMVGFRPVITTSPGILFFVSLSLSIINIGLRIFGSAWNLFCIWCYFQDDDDRGDDHDYDDHDCD